MHAWQMVVLMTSDAEGPGSVNRIRNFAAARIVRCSNESTMNFENQYWDLQTSCFIPASTGHFHPVAFSFGISSALERSTYRVDGTGLWPGQSQNPGNVYGLAGYNWRGQDSFPSFSRWIDLRESAKCTDNVELHGPTMLRAAGHLLIHNLQNQGMIICTSQFHWFLALLSL